MNDTSESLNRKITSAGEIGTVVRTMKAMAASNIHQFEMAISSLSDYYRTVALGIIAYFKQEKVEIVPEQKNRNEKKSIIAIVVGSDMGLIGQFNDRLAEFVIKTLSAIEGKKEIWTVGERVQLPLKDAGLTTTKSFVVPNSVKAITPLVSQILMESEQSREKGELKELYVFHNCPNQGMGYEQVSQRLFPLDEKWKHNMDELKWPTKKPPQIVGEMTATLTALISEYLFVSLFRACAGSLASENSGRLEAMQRAEKNIKELLEDLNNKYNRLRQNSIDEELFDVISGFEALQKKQIRTHAFPLLQTLGIIFYLPTLHCFTLLFI